LRLLPVGRWLAIGAVATPERPAPADRDSIA
jgi:hypothetical protein